MSCSLFTRNPKDWYKGFSRFSASSPPMWLDWDTRGLVSTPRNLFPGVKKHSRRQISGKQCMLDATTRSCRLLGTNNNGNADVNLPLPLIMIRCCRDHMRLTVSSRAMISPQGGNGSPKGRGKARSSHFRLIFPEPSSHRPFQAITMRPVWPLDAIPHYQTWQSHEPSRKPAEGAELMMEAKASQHRPPRLMCGRAEILHRNLVRLTRILICNPYAGPAQRSTNNQPRTFLLGAQLCGH